MSTIKTMDALMRELQELLSLKNGEVGVSHHLLHVAVANASQYLGRVGGR
jgi:hypothetical protein